MSDLRQTLRNWRHGITLLGLPVADINWQSIAVLLHNLPDKAKFILSNLLDEGGGWATKGWNPDCDGGTSLYLSPKGMAYWLHYGGHSELYHRLFGASPEKMDCAGWIHISSCRVHIKAAPTISQRRWLATTTPVDKRGRESFWKEAPVPAYSALTKAPVPYDKVSRFDVRPVPDFDLDNDDHWERLIIRINRAADPGVPD